MPNLKLVQLGKSFPNVVAVDGVSLTIFEGEFFAILGPSGCGKTTLLHLIAGLIRADMGDVFLGGARLTEIPANKRDINTVFQSYALFPHMTVFQNIAFPLRMRGNSRAEIGEKVTRMLAFVSLEGLEQRRPSQLSGGQQQRVALARALVGEPSVVLLDEPLSALDARLRDNMRGELRAIQRAQQRIFVYVTHDQEEALSLADRVAIMKDGRIIQVGSPTEVYRRPTSAFVATFLGQANFFEGRGSNGRPALGVVRPEAVRMKKRDEPVDSHDYEERGIIEETFFVGPEVRFHVRLDSGELFKVSKPGAEEKEVYRRGSSVRLLWREQDCVWLPNEGRREV